MTENTEHDPQPEVLASVVASAPRKWFGVGSMVSLGVILIYVTIVYPPDSFLQQAFLLFVGGAAFWLAEKTRRATERTVELTGEGLRDSSGEVIAVLSDISGVERGTFALKPSNGFMFRLKTKHPRRWLPGVWWCLGRTVGIGGVTAAPQTKAMAQILEALLVEQAAASAEVSSQD